MERTDLKRRLTAVLLADVVGYSRLMSVDEEGTHVRLANYVKDLIGPKIAQHRGRLIRSMGDGFLVEFDSAVDAVRCGIEIQRGLTERGAGVDVARQIQLRIGINTGDVIVDERDIYGNSVNIAARLEGLARPGEVYVTRGVRDQLWGYPTLSFASLGTRRVKNIARPIRVFRVEDNRDQKVLSLPQRGRVAVGRWSRAASGTRPRAALLIGLVVALSAILAVAVLPIWRASPPPPRASIVVLPFANLSSDPKEDDFADAVTDDVTTDLGRVHDAFVIARGTAFTYKGKAVDAKQVGQEVGARYVLEGSVRRIGTGVQTNARLIDAATGYQVWADRFDNKIEDLAELEEAVTGRIASSLDIQLVRAEGRLPLDRRSPSPSAVELRVHAMSLFFSSITPEHSLAARRYLEEAVRLDPQSAEAWGWLGTVLVSDYLNHWNKAGKEQVKEAEQAVRKAIAIDPNVAVAHYADGFIHRTRGEHQAAYDAFSRAVELNRSFAGAYAQKGNELILLGKPKRAVPLVERAIKLSPRDPSLGIFYWILGRAQFFAGNYSEAISWLQKSIEVRPNIWYNRLYLISAFALSKNVDKSKNLLREFNDNPQFKGYTLERVIKNEKANPNDNKIVVAGREQFHKGLLDAGMAER